MVSYRYKTRRASFTPVLRHGLLMKENSSGKEEIKLDYKKSFEKSTRSKSIEFEVSYL
jgi:hypothetical protein